MAQLVKNLPEMWETWVGSLGWEDLLEKGKATHSSIMAWRIPWTVQSMGSQRVRHDSVPFTSLHFTPWRFSGKESACNAGDLGSIPGLGRSPGDRNGNPIHILTWRIPWTEQPGGLQSMGSQRVRHNWRSMQSSVRGIRTGLQVIEPKDHGGF